MEFTGERAIPGQTDPDLMNEHWARYAFAEALVGSKRVLDAGCGVGYGAARLAEVAAEVVALDQARDPLTAGGKQYSHPRLRFVQGDCTRFPFADSSLDAVVAFEVIEHLDEWKALIEESRRVLVPAGQFIVSTPNRLYYGEAREDPNPFHVHEFTHDEFREELGRCFPHVMLFLENHADALVFTGEQFQGIRARLETADPAPDEAHFFLAVCSQRPLHGSQAFVYLPSSANLLREREKHIGLLQGEVNKRDEWLAAARVELDKFDAVQESAKRTIAQLEQENADKENWAQRLDGELAGVLAEREKCIQLIEDSEKRVTERTDWAQRLDGELAGVLAEREKCIQLIEDSEKRVTERTDWAQRLDGELAGVLAEREKCIQLIEGVTERTDWAQRLDGELAGVLAEREKCIQLIEDSEKRVTERTDWAQRLDGELAGVLAEREKCIQLIEDSEKRVTERTDWAQRLDGELAGVLAEREKCIQLIEDSEKRVTERTDWAQRLDGELAGVLAEREKCIQLIEDSEKRVTERTDWAQRLDGELDEVRQELAAIRGSLAYRVSKRIGIMPARAAAPAVQGSSSTDEDGPNSA